MKMFQPLPLVLVLLVVPVVADDIVGELSFTSGNRLSGLSGMSYKGEHLVLQKGGPLDAPTEVRLDRLSDLRLAGGVTPEVESSHVALLQIANGDELRGKLKGLDHEHVTLDTWYGGKVRIKRSMCRSLKIQRVDPALYVGPDALENWTTIDGEEAWALRDRELVSKVSGSIAREIALPERCRIRFHLAWERSLKLRILLFSSEGDTVTPNNCYDLVIQRRFAYLRKRWMTAKSGGTNNVGRPTNIPVFAEQNEAHVELFVDREAGSITLYLDGRQAQVWKDEHIGSGNFGNWLHFVSDDEPIQISQLRAGPWQGALPEGLDEMLQEGGLQAVPEVISEVVATEDGALVLKRKIGEIKIPAGRTFTINLVSSEEAEHPRRMIRDVRAWLREGGFLTIQLRALDGNSLTGYSQAFGECKFDLSAFSRIEFNIYDEDLESGR